MNHEHEPHDQQPEGEAQQPEHQHGPEREPRYSALQIWVADLAAYNNGHLHGRWIETSSDPDAMWVEIADMLRRSPIPGAEEIAVFDHEGFGPARVGEFTPISTIARITAGGHRPANGRLLPHRAVEAHQAWARQTSRSKPPGATDLKARPVTPVVNAHPDAYPRFGRTSSWPSRRS